MKKDCKFTKKELELGIAMEMEHTQKKWFAEKIAAEHLCEFPKYYSKGILPMKRRLTKLRRAKK